MEHPHWRLDGARAKIARANEHLATLEAEWGAAVEANREHLFRVRMEPDGGYLLFVGSLTIPSVRLAIIGGEIAYQLRSALEHVAQALVGTNTGQPPAGHVVFPIKVWPAYSQSFYEAMRNGSLRGARRDAIEHIGKEQPYLAGTKSKADEHPLAALKTFSDVDKHRTLFVAATVPSDTAQLQSIVQVPAALRIDWKMRIDSGEPLAPGRPIARFRPYGLIGAGPPQEVFLHGPVTLEVRFGDGESPFRPRQSLQSISDYVSNFVDSCEPFFEVETT